MASLINQTVENCERNVWSHVSTSAEAVQNTKPVRSSWVKNDVAIDSSPPSVCFTSVRFKDRTRRGIRLTADDATSVSIGGLPGGLSLLCLQAYIID